MLQNILIKYKIEEVRQSICDYQPKHKSIEIWDN